ncbi:hypothetical protein ASF83_06815 [Plantibacter sp. Leaf171]|uniref:spermidine synthase n=1 Tax=unclassified Plantibacter TaxID=2624265 RepID=UPI0006F25B98|nr:MULTISPECIES: fused MFS/spermidine synthase [unclassified Plantibacter]KQM15650.1 hypothetical protein ASE44_06830 [Plantibacter sp. Leaf1]KQR58794.1 hypothetical protein ASF83_06815 [Plantibacter sp. Leaf171]
MALFSRSRRLPLDQRDARLTLLDKRMQRYELSVDDIPQSVVSLTDPRSLEYPYIRHIARVIDAEGPAGEPLFTVHLGAGALTLPRYVQATRPGSPQLVVEFEPELYAAMLEALPLPEGSRVEVRFGDARAVADEPVDDIAATAADGTVWRDAKVTVVDLWDAAVIHRRVASLEFYRRVAARSAADGVIAVNLLDGSPFDYARRQAATLRTVFAHVAVVLDFDPVDDEGPLGNVVVFASDAPLAAVTHPQLFGAPAPEQLHGDALTAWIDGAAVMTDADGEDSPDPDDPRWD